MPSDSTCVLNAEPGKLDIKRREPGVYPLLNTLQTSDILYFCVDSASLATSLKSATSGHIPSGPTVNNIKRRDPGVNPLLNTFQTSDHGDILDFCVDSASLATSLKSATSRHIPSGPTVNMRANR